MSGKPGTHWSRNASTSPMAVAAIRERIQVGLIVDSLQKHVAGKKKMAASQVTAGLGLLRKCVPDLLATQHSGGLELSTSLVDRLAEGAKRAGKR